MTITSTFGHRWCIELYPGGNDESADGKVGLYLTHLSEGSIEVQGTFIVSSIGFLYYMMKESVFQGMEDHWGNPNFADRAKLISARQDGSLVIEVQMMKQGHTRSCVSCQRKIK